MARRRWRARIALLGGRPVHRADFVTDNGNDILDVHGLAIEDPVDLETELNQIPGVVTVGLFARRPADLLLVGTAAGVRRPATALVNGVRPGPELPCPPPPPLLGS